MICTMLYEVTEIDIAHNAVALMSNAVLSHCALP